MGMTFTGHNRLNMENRIMVSDCHDNDILYIATIRNILHVATNIYFKKT